MVQTEQLLPLDEISAEFPAEPTESTTVSDHLYEPTQEEILQQILPKHLNAQMWKVLLDSNAAEHAARMTAMETQLRMPKTLSRSWYCNETEPDKHWLQKRWPKSSAAQSPQVQIKVEQIREGRP